ncbi:MAG TPA: cupredoxin family copper-binding protein [Candidatus Dormibacteraeota bacterium]|nr:cupredoxin family copper-binding protein [Candidatus Dormibacteraeota bacterium]
MRRSALPVLLAITVLAIAACSSGSTPGASAGANATAVTIQGFAFGPSTLDVAVGSTVTWTNKDSTTHTVTANDGSFDSQVPSGQTFSQTFSKAGTFAYHCKIHPTMTATITVH